MTNFLLSFSLFYFNHPAYGQASCNHRALITVFNQSEQYVRALCVCVRACVCVCFHIILYANCFGSCKCALRVSRILHLGSYVSGERSGR